MFFFQFIDSPRDKPKVIEDIFPKFKVAVE